MEENQNRLASYRQGTAYGRPLVKYEDNGSGCLAVTVNAVFLVGGAVIGFLLTYYGYLYLVKPLVNQWWIMLSTALGGG